ncbi:hypothetical protein B0919_06560 [Hymenobacter sp. CRA2]|nr:hypothetical protein B0919_06560 [Hymenobacter sp. CRA2]
MLGAALLLLPLAACDRSWAPGIDVTNNDSFATVPPATRVDTERDSVSGGGKAYRPVGTGSLARSSAEAISSQPGGDPNTSKFTDGGTTDGSSTTSGRSLTNRGTSNTEVPGTTRGPATGTGDGRGSLNNAPRQTSQTAASQAESNAPQQAKTGTGNNNGQSNKNR